MIKRILLTATCLLSLSGCSFVLVEGPPQLAAGQRATAPVVCTDNIILPVLDFLGGGTSMAYAVSAFFLGDVASAIEDEFGITETVSDELNVWGFASLAVGGTLVYSGMQGRGQGEQLQAGRWRKPPLVRRLCLLHRRASSVVPPSCGSRCGMTCWTNIAVSTATRPFRPCHGTEVPAFSRSIRHSCEGHEVDISSAPEVER